MSPPSLCADEERGATVAARVGKGRVGKAADEIATGVRCSLQVEGEPLSQPLLPEPRRLPRGTLSTDGGWGMREMGPPPPGNRDS